jgi:hypothetical protein
LQHVVQLVLALAGIAFLGHLMATEDQPNIQQAACEAQSPGSVLHLTTCAPNQATRSLAAVPRAETMVVASGAPSLR